MEENNNVAGQFCIVYDKNTLPMANSLFNKVRDKGYSCVTWSEKQYYDQKPTFENDKSNKVLFLSRKLVKESFSNPDLKPLTNGKCLFFQEGLNAGIRLYIGSTFERMLEKDSFIKWSEQNKTRRIVFALPRFAWKVLRVADMGTSPIQLKEYRRELLWEGVNFFYEHYLDSFMRDEPIKPIGVVVEVENWKDIVNSELL